MTTVSLTGRDRRRCSSRPRAGARARPPRGAPACRVESFLPVSRKPWRRMRLPPPRINTVVGDLDGNRARILANIGEARSAGADLVLFPELAVTGYPPEDLLLRPGFLRAAARSLVLIAAETQVIACLVGAPW